MNISTISIHQVEFLTHIGINIVLILLLFSLTIQTFYLINQRKEPDPFSHYLLSIGLVLLLLITTFRSVEIKFIAIASKTDTLIIVSEFILAIALFYRYKLKSKANSLILFGDSWIILLFLALAASPLMPKTVSPLIPQLKSPWMIWHISMALLGIAFFSTGFVASVSYLTTSNSIPKESLDKLSFTTNLYGLLVYGIGGVIVGAIWAKSAWGRYWAWDPKENWALITCIIYILYFLLRIFIKNNNKIPAWISIIGFLAVIFTYLGVNYLLSGTHSYN